MLQGKSAFSTFFSLAKQYAFWMFFFASCRAIFLLYNFRLLKEAGIGEAVQSFWHALYLDNSITCYILIFPFVLMFFQSLVKHPFLCIANKVYSIILISVFSLLIVSELEIFREWGVKLNYKAMSYLVRPAEVFETARPVFLIAGILVAGLHSFLWIFLYHRFVFQKIRMRRRRYLFSALFLIIAPFLLFGGIRGGTQPIPIQISDVYFSKNNFINLATVNSLFHLGSSFDKNWRYRGVNPFQYYSYEEAKRVVDSMYTIEKDTTIRILTNETPNIVLIILESWAGANIRSLGGYEGVTPRFDSLAANGLSFSNTYATGALSDEGMIAVFGSFPCLPEVIIITQPDKYRNLPCLAMELKKKNYHTSFLYGGQLNYGNIKSYIYYNRFDNITEGADFPGDIPQGRLGVQDEYMFDRMICDISGYPEPFFATAFTLSSHSPFDHGMKPVLDWGDEFNAYLNSVYYTDSCLGRFVDEARKQPWFDNTLFIFVADHSHRTPDHLYQLEPEYRRIPFLLYGNVLKQEYRGRKWPKFFSQVDIASTLLTQLRLDDSSFKWSRNIMNPYTKDFFYYGFDFGVGFILPDGNYFVYEHEQDKYLLKKFNTPEDEKRTIRMGKAYLQVLYEEYLR